MRCAGTDFRFTLLSLITAREETTNAAENAEDSDEEELWRPRRFDGTFGPGPRGSANLLIGLRPKGQSEDWRSWKGTSSASSVLSASAPARDFG